MTIACLERMTGTALTRSNADPRATPPDVPVPQINHGPSSVILQVVSLVNSWGTLGSSLERNPTVHRSA